MTARTFGFRDISETVVRFVPAMVDDRVKSDLALAS
jgi:hypothetical protein